MVSRLPPPEYRKTPPLDDSELRGDEAAVSKSVPASALLRVPWLPETEPLCVSVNTRIDVDRAGAAAAKVEFGLALENDPVTSHVAAVEVELAAAKIAAASRTDYAAVETGGAGVGIKCR